MISELANRLKIKVGCVIALMASRYVDETFKDYDVMSSLSLGNYQPQLKVVHAPHRGPTSTPRNGGDKVSKLRHVQHPPTSPLVLSNTPSLSLPQDRLLTKLLDTYNPPTVARPDTTTTCRTRTGYSDEWNPKSRLGSAVSVEQEEHI